MKKIKRLNHSLLAIVLCFLLLTLTGAKRSQSCKKKLLPLTSIHIVDRNGFSETISNKERLNQFQNVNFLSSQPYQKVLRIYARDSKGNLRSVVTTYHENGNPKQFLEILNARAHGNYYEWHENGKMAVMSRIIGGTADVTNMAEKTWLFDGPSYAWDEEEHPIAEIYYSQGSLEGMTTYFHPNGVIWKKIPFYKNQIEGTVEIYRSNGEILQQSSYCQGQKQGSHVRYWSCEQVASQEEYCNGKLLSGQYFDRQGSLVAEVKEGSGFRAIFGKEHIQELQEFADGSLEGEVKVFNQEGCIKRIYHVRNGIKHGEEIEYYDRFFASSAPAQPKLSFYWYDGKVQGMVKTWYANGVLESQKEMANNVKNGVLSAWYRDGNLMMIEEYNNDKLVRGDYFKKGERIAVSQVSEGKGTVSIFDADGHFVQKILYVNGKPEM
ncbi:MAG: toxin-antitoxin system YwqK family antitoxin [Parachlamydiaceae bacterium]